MIATMSYAKRLALLLAAATLAFLLYIIALPLFGSYLRGANSDEVMFVIPVVVIFIGGVAFLFGTEGSSESLGLMRPLAGALGVAILSVFLAFLLFVLGMDVIPKILAELGLYSPPSLD